jgi:hypothetical protein
MSHELFRSSIAAVVLVLTACAGGTDAGEDGGAGLDGADRALEWEREVLYEVGGAEAEGWAAFGRIVDVGFDGEGRLYVLDSQASQVHVLSRDGSLVRSIGTSGEGPGELSQAFGMAVFADGTVSVFDIGKFSLVVYGPDGEWIRDLRIDPSETGLLSTPILPLPYHNVLASIGGRVRMGPPAAGSEPPEPGRAIVMVPLDEAESLGPQVVMRGWEAPPPGGAGEQTTMRGQGGAAISLQMNRMRAFTPAVRLGVLRDGRILMVDTTTYRIRIHGSDGTAQSQLSRPIPPIPVTSPIEEKERARRLAAIESGGGLTVMTFGRGGGAAQMPDMSEMQRNQIADMLFYPEIQVIERIAADWQDRIWVERASGNPGEPGPTDVITADGDYVGTLAPDGLRTPRAFGPDGLAAWIETDDLDVQHVVVARIPSSRD